MNLFFPIANEYLKKKVVRVKETIYPWMGYYARTSNYDLKEYLTTLKHDQVQRSECETTHNMIPILSGC